MGVGGAGAVVDTPHHAATVVHIPHSSTRIPADVRPTLAVSDSELELELLRLTDRYTDELFDLDPAIATPVVFGVSRLVVDPERFSDDALEPMAARGMGAVYMSRTDGTPLRATLTIAQRARLLARFYEPHHAALEAAVQEALLARGRCLIIDAHSFPSEPLPCDMSQERPRPDVCIGTDAFHTPAALASNAVAAFEARSLEVSVDRPYSGTIVPSRWHGRDARVSSVMIEINRRLYMDEATGERAATFSPTQETVISVLLALIDAYAR